MKIAFIHHHLREGGVTRVITDQIDALKNDVEALVITGEPPYYGLSVPIIVIPELAYDRDRKDNLNPQEIAILIISKINAFWKKGADILHFHNPTLGKNKDFIEIIKILIGRGIKTLLQIHDFAEDGRPLNYCQKEYPSDCHYAVINKKAYQYLIKSGLKKEGLHLLTNSVKPLRINGKITDENDLILYPVRAIRRKNIGEAILLSLFFNKNERLGITLEPTSELDIKSYKGWIDFVKSERLNVYFGLGIENRFKDVLAKTKCIVTTSIKEGFGFSFLEPWTIGSMLFGRLLKDVCSDFMEKGIILSHLYEDIKTPLNFIDQDIFYKKWKSCFLKRLNLYNIDLSIYDIKTLFSFLIKDECIDFGCLSEDLQKHVILKILKSKKNLKKFLDLNHFLKNTIHLENADEIVENNRKIVLEEYSLKKYRVNLLQIYKKVSGTDVRHSINKKILLEQFIAPENNNLLLCDLAYE